MSGTSILLIAMALAASVGAVAIPITLAILRHRTGFRFAATRDGRIAASDVGVGSSLLLRDDRLGICGKPDYLLEISIDGERRFVPVEVKPTRKSQRLYDSDRVQIGAYLVALRATMPDRAGLVGYVRYQSRTFEVPLTPELEAEVERLTTAVRRGRGAAFVHRNHNVVARCRSCPVRQHCDERLSD